MKTQQTPLTLEEYLKAEYDRSGAVDHSIRVTFDAEGRARFYVHPRDRDGDTLDFKLKKNALTTVVYRKPVGAGSVPL